MAWTFARQPSGPHQDSKPSFVVHSSQISSTEARYVRSMTVVDLVAAAVALLFLSLMWLAPGEGFSVSCVSFRAPLPGGRGVLPMGRGTGPATCRARGTARA